MTWQTVQISVLYVSLLINWIVIPALNCSAPHIFEFWQEILIPLSINDNGFLSLCQNQTLPVKIKATCSHWKYYMLPFRLSFLLMRCFLSEVYDEWCLNLKQVIFEGRMQKDSICFFIQYIAFANNDQSTCVSDKNSLMVFLLKNHKLVFRQHNLLLWGCSINIIHVYNILIGKEKPDRRLRNQY